jgi:hypothetical protein
MRPLKASVRIGLLALACATIGIGSAHASGSFSCEADDKSLKFSAEAMFSHGLGEQFTNFKGTMSMLMKDAPPDLAAIELGSDNLPHHWFHGDVLKLHIYREREGTGKEGYVELFVETKQNPNDETDFSGTYELIVFRFLSEQDPDGRTLKAKGKVSCSVG